MQCESLGERPAVCVCVFLSLCLSSEATFCPFKAVTDWPLSPISRSLSCFLSIIPPLSLPLFSFCLSNPIHRSLFLQLYPPPFLSYLLLSTVARIHPYKSFNPVAGPENLIFSFPSFSKRRNLSTGMIVLLVSNATHFAQESRCT